MASHALQFCFEIGAHPVTLSGLEFSMKSRLASGSQWSSYFSFPMLAFTGVSQHAKL